MSKPAHTPGPWEVRATPWSGGHRFFVGRAETGSRHTLANINSVSDHPGEAESNAALIAAAPELFEALAFYASEENWRTRGHPQIDADDTPIRHDRGHVARAALAKAEGSASNQQQTEGAHGHQQPE